MTDCELTSLDNLPELDLTAIDLTANKYSHIHNSGWEILNSLSWLTTRIWASWSSTKTKYPNFKASKSFPNLNICKKSILLTTQSPNLITTEHGFLISTFFPNKAFLNLKSLTDSIEMETNNLKRTSSSMTKMTKKILTMTRTETMTMTTKNSTKTTKKNPLHQRKKNEKGFVDFVNDLSIFKIEKISFKNSKIKKGKPCKENEGYIPLIIRFDRSDHFNCKLIFLFDFRLTQKVWEKVN